MIVFSPSNLSQYRTCPRRFAGQSIWKDIKWKGTTAKTRGTLVHEALEKALKTGKVALPSDVDSYFTNQKIQELRQAVADGAQLFTEHEMCVNRRMAPTGWWDEDGYMRAKADAVVLYPDRKSALIIDWKTGKKWDEDAFQLRMETMLVMAYHQRPVVRYAFYYVDQGETVDGEVDFTNGIDAVRDIAELMKDAEKNIGLEYFPPKKNQFCRWCDYHKTPRCGL